MNNILYLVLGLVIGAAAIFFSLRQTDLRRTATSSDGRDIEATVAQAVESALADALETLDQRSQRDRQDSINLASDRVAQASGEQLGRRAEQIDASLRGVQESIGLRIQQMDDEIKRLREQNAEKFGSVDKAVSDLLKSTGDLNNVLSSSQARGQWGERMAEDLLKAAGLIEGINYEKQDTISGGGRPDYTFLMPPDRVLYMDVKFLESRFHEGRARPRERTRASRLRRVNHPAIPRLCVVVRAQRKHHWLYSRSRPITHRLGARAQSCVVFSPHAVRIFGRCAPSHRKFPHRRNCCTNYADDGQVSQAVGVVRQVARQGQAQL